MHKKLLSVILSSTLIVWNLGTVHALSKVEDAAIPGNTVLIGEHLFQLDDAPEAFKLDNFMNAVRSIGEGAENAVYYKDHRHNWYELIADEHMKTAVEAEKIENTVSYLNGNPIGELRETLKNGDVITSADAFVESIHRQGTFETVIGLKLSKETSATFADFKGGDVDAISGASLVNTAPKGVKATLHKTGEKEATLRLTGTTSAHEAALNQAQSEDTDYNGNGVYGDLKLLMLPELFNGVQEVENGGVYATFDLVYNDGVSAAVIDKAKSRVSNVEQVHYGVVALTQGTASDYQFRFNGQVIAPTKVNDSGTVVKFEMNPFEVAHLEIVTKEGTKVDEIQLGTGRKPFTQVIQNQDPDRVLISGPMSKLDYALAPYDSAGMVRSALEKTTFNTESEGEIPVDETLPVLTSDKTALGDAVVISFDKSASKWAEGLYEVCVDSGLSQGLRQPIEFKLREGALVIPADAEPLAGRNGKHALIVKSQGFNDARHTVEIVKPAGKLMLSPNFNWWAHNELLFELKDFNYAVTNPIHTVELDGVALPSDHSAYHVISSLVRLEGTVLEKLTVGRHTLVVKATGFEDYTATFDLEKAPNGHKNPTLETSETPSTTRRAVVDAIAGASTIGGGSGSGDGEGSGSGGGMIRANVMVDFDHLVNARILTELGMNTPYVDAVLSWWGAFTKDAVVTDNSEKLVRYASMKHAVGIDSEQGYTTFKAYYDQLPEMPSKAEIMDPSASIHEALYLDKPYRVKNLLHDGVLGDTYAYGEAIAKESPSFESVEATSEEPIQWTYEDTAAARDWAANLMHIKLDTTYLRYTHDAANRTLTLTSEVPYGTSQLSMGSEGYKTVVTTVDRYKAAPASLSAESSESGVIINGLNADFIAHLNGVYLNEKPLYTNEAVGSDGHYAVVGQQIVLGETLFTEAENAQVLKLTADTYRDLYFRFTPSALGTGTVAGADVPEWVALLAQTPIKPGTSMTVTVATPLDSRYQSALTEVTVNGRAVAYEPSGFYAITLAGDLFNDYSLTEVVLKAKGYKDKVFTVEVSDALSPVPAFVTLEGAGETVAFGTPLKIQLADAYQWSISDYGKAVRAVEISGVTYTPETLGITGSTTALDVAPFMSIGAQTVVLKADGYEDQTFSVTVKKGQGLVRFIQSDSLVYGEALTVSLGETVRLALGDSKKSYKDIVTDVSIDGKRLSSGYTLAEETVGYGTHYVLTLDAAQLEAGPHTLAIRSEHYEDVVLTLDVTEEKVAQ